jgi:hypothetical protein
MLGEFDIGLFDELGVAQRAYGVLMTVLLLIISAILLMNL